MYIKENKSLNQIIFLNFVRTIKDNNKYLLMRRIVGCKGIFKLVTKDYSDDGNPFYYAKDIGDIIDVLNQANPPSDKNQKSVINGINYLLRYFLDVNKVKLDRINEIGDCVLKTSFVEMYGESAKSKLDELDKAMKNEMLNEIRCRYEHEIANGRFKGDFKTFCKEIVKMNTDDIF
mgnify:CR=1 FL=1